MDVLKGNCTRSDEREREDIWHLIKRLSNLVNYTISSLIYLMRFSMITNLLQRDFLAENLSEFSRLFSFDRDSYRSPSVYKILFPIQWRIFSFFFFSRLGVPHIFIFHLILTSLGFQRPLRAFLELGLVKLSEQHASRATAAGNCFPGIWS